MSRLAGSNNARGGTFDALYPGATHKQAISGTAATVGPFLETTTVVQVCADTACFIAIGVSPVATVASTYCPANFSQKFACNPGDSLSVIGSSGNLYVTEGA